MRGGWQTLALKEYADQDVAPFYISVVIPIGETHTLGDEKFQKRYKSKHVCPQSNNDISDRMTIFYYILFSTSISFQQLDTLKSSSLSALNSCKSCLMLSHVCYVLIHNWLHFSIWVDEARVYKLVQMKNNVKLPLLWLFLHPSTRYSCVK